MSPSKDVAKAWIKQKKYFEKNKLQGSKFSFFVCLALVFGIASGYMVGFAHAFYTMSDNYGAVYEELLSDLESSRKCFEKEKSVLESLRQVEEAKVVYNHPWWNLGELIDNDFKVVSCLEIKNVSYKIKRSDNNKELFGFIEKHCGK